MTRRFWQLSLGLVLGVALLATAYLLINTTFMFYDDEGYLLLTYKNFIAGARLYDDIFTQYGPWPYLYHQFVTTVLHQPLTHMLGRDLTALHWVLCALLGGAIAARATGRTAAAVCTSLIIFGLLWQMDSEPSHPGSLISAMLAAAAFAAATTDDTRRWGWLGIILGTMAGLLFLTKINVGLLFIAGVGAGALRFTAWPERWRRPADILAAVGLLAVPWGLMSKKLDDPWAMTFAIQFTAGAAGLLWVTPTALAGRWVPPRTWAAATGAFIVTLVVTSAAVCLQGTTLHALIQTVLVNPLRQPASFMFGFTWIPETWPATIACWLATAWAGWELRRKGEVSRATIYGLIALRLAALAAFMLNAGGWLTIYGVGRFIVFCLPLLPVFLVPLAPRAERGPAQPRISPWLPCIALPQVLHAFPVAGSQMGWGTFLLLPIMVAGLHEAWLALARSAPQTGRWVPRAGWSLLLLVSLGQFWLLVSNGWDRYSLSKPLGLPGAEDIRLDGPARMALRVLTTNASVHADLLFSRPGMFSYNQWSGVPTPTMQNATHWFWLLDAPAQAAITERLRQTPRSAVITNQALDDFLDRINVPTQSPLQDYIRDHYRELFVLNSFHFLVPRESRAVPFCRIDLRGLDVPESTEKSPALLRSNIALDGLPATVRLQSVYAPWRVMVDYTDLGGRIYLEPITSQGDVTGPAIQLPVNRPLKGLFRLTIFATQAPKLGLPQGAALTVLGPDGAVLSESVF